ncbi:MAG TPA: translocation/assembly module TamB domain-containing protein [Myxococcales bacterium]|nr:translocation/assembly module TamB domain-containing protein [Myxococcales bacterium]
MAALLLLLSTGAGRGALARLPLEALDRAIAGRIEFRDARVEPDGEVDITGARLFDPTGRLLISAQRVRARVDVLDLLRRRVVVRRARLEGVVFRLGLGGPHGADVAAAFRPRHPRPGAVPPPAWSVQLDDLVALIQRFELSTATAGARPLVRLVTSGGRLSGRLSLVGGALSIDGSFDGGRVERPVSSAVDASAHVTLHSSALEVLGEVAVGGGRADGKLVWQLRGGEGELDLAHVHLDEALLGRLAPGLRLRPLDLRAEVRSLRTASSGGSAAQSRLAVHAETTSGSARLTAMVDPASAGGNAVLVLRDLDPGSFSPRFPSGSLEGRVVAEGSGVTGRSAKWSLAATLHPSSLKGLPIGPGELQADLTHDRLRVSRLSLGVPGGQLEAFGAVGPFAVTGFARLRATRLEALRTFTERFGDLSVPRLSGDATAEVVATGPPEHPALHVHVDIPRATLLSVAVRGASVDAWTPRLATGGEVSGTLAAAQLDLLGRQVTALSARAHLRDRRLSIATAGRVASEKVSIAGRFRLADDLGGAAVLRLGLRAGRLRGHTTRVASISWRNGPTVSNLKLAAGRARLSLDGGLPSQGTPYLHLKLRDLDLATLPALARLHPRLRGRVDAETTVQQYLGHRLASLKLTLRRGIWAGLPGPCDLQLALAYARGKLGGRVALEAGPRTLLRARLTAALPAERIDRLRTGEEVRTLLLDAPGQFDGRVGPLDVFRLEAALGFSRRLRGSVSGTWSLRGTWKQPRGEAHLDAVAAALEGRELGDVSVSLRARQRETRVAAVFRRPGRAAVLTAQLAAAAAPEGVGWAVPLAGSATLAKLPLAEGGPAAFGGLLSGAAQLSGTPAAPRLAAKLSASGLSFRGQPLGRADASLDWRGPQARIDAELAEPLGGRLTASVSLPLSLPRRRTALAFVVGDGPLKGALRSRRLDLSFLSGLGGLLRAVEGNLDADLRIGGTIAAPSVEGPLELTRGRLALRGLGTYRDVELRATAEGRSATVTELTGTSGIGTLTGHGRVAWPVNGGGPQLALTCAARDFALWSEDQLRAILSAQVQVSGTLAARGAALSVRASEARLSLPETNGRALEPLTLPRGIEIVGPRRPAPGSPYPLDVHVATVGSALVSGSDVELPASADLEARIGASTRLTGRVDVGRGKLTIFGRALDVEHADLDFGPEAGPGRAPDDPLLGGLAMQKTSAATVYVSVSGSLRKPQFDLRSDPPLSHEQIATLLATGVLDPSSAAAAAALAPGTVGGATVAASAAGAFLSGALKDALGGVLPLDVLTLEPTQAEIGKRIGRLYLGAVENFGVADPRQNQSEIRARYRLGRGLSLDSKIGDAGADSLDLSWERSW